MSPYLTLIIQGIILPIGVSGLLLWLGPTRDGYRVAGNALAWLLAYGWITGFPAIPPKEAVDWLWLLLVASYAVCHITQHHARWLPLTLILAGTLTAVVWPVLYYQPSAAVAGELVILVIAGSFLFRRAEQAVSVAPAFTLSINAGGLAIASALGGSLLVGQLLTALAAVIGVYALAEIASRLHRTPFSTQQVLVFLPLYLALLGIARVYAELPLASAALLLASPVIGIRVRWRHSWLISLILSAGAVGPLLLNGDNTAYY